MTARSCSTRRPGRLVEARVRLLGVLGVAALAGALAGGTADAAPATRPPAARPEPLAVPLASSFSTTGGTWVDVPMGRLGQLVNTFWQTFVLRPGASRWSLVTPPGVADNGGLVSTAGPGGEVLAGFEASQLLGYSPLAETSDAGRAWSAGLVPSRLAATPDALALSGDGALLALLGGHDASVVSSAGSTTTWHTLVRTRTLARSQAGRTCGLQRLVAVAFAPDGMPLAGATCDRTGVVGIVARRGAVWTLEPVHLPPPGSSADELLRLSSSGGHTAALVEIDRPGHAALVGAWPDGATRWSASKALALGPGARLVASGTTESGAIVALTSTSAGLHLELTGSTRAGAAWRALPAPPSGTAAVAVTGTAGRVRVDAFGVDGSRLTDEVLDLRSARWVRSQTIEVPITYGSSG